MNVFKLSAGKLGKRTEKAMGMFYKARLGLQKVVNDAYVRMGEVEKKRQERREEFEQKEAELRARYDQDETKLQEEYQDLSQAAQQAQKQLQKLEEFIG